METTEPKVEEPKVIVPQEGPPIKQAQISKSDREIIKNLEKHRAKVTENIGFYQDCLTTANSYINLETAKMAEKYGIEKNKQYELNDEGVLKIIEAK